MSYKTISFSPTLNNNAFSDRFKQIDKIFSTLTGEKPISEIPNYNLIKKDKNQYELIIHTPGYNDNEINIVMEDEQLNISSNKKQDCTQEKKEQIQYIHHGIQDNNFSMSFYLYKPIKINYAQLKLGILTINFEYKMPELKKTKKIDIQT
ncbi:Small heat shock protein Ibp [Buchnera aphidicola (Pterocallis alni)]|uniref:Hsp20 family protein n=1 Tax=Buchnera aphidicola TaxID=9 RepID=UPI003464D057